MIAFKTTRALDEWADLHPSLREILLWLHNAAWPSSVQLIITRIAEPDPNQKTAVHTSGPPHRAADIRSNVLVDTEILALQKRINDRYEYDPARPNMEVAVYHDAGGGFHFHIQVHDQTRLRPSRPPMDTA